MTQILVPGWVAEEERKPAARAYDVAEADMLREFYKRWEILHGVPKDALHRTTQEEAAQSMVEQAHLLRRFYAH